MADARWVLYGATGYTGALIAEVAAREGLRPVLAGRSPDKVAKVAAKHGLEHAAVPLDDAEGLRRLIRGARVVMHAAGPYVDTSLPMVRACLDEQVSYLDITGELPVFEQTFSFDAAARDRGIVLISGVGFDVVPTDCLAKYVSEHTPGATELEIAIAAQGKLSAGTVKSALGIVSQGGLLRRDGELRTAPFGRGAKRLRFPGRELWGMPAPLADLATAYRSTGIPNITVYAVVGARVARLAGRTWPLGMVGMPLARGLLRIPAVERSARAFVERRVTPATAEERQQGRTTVYARASGPGGSTEAWLQTPDAYSYTAELVVKSVERVLADRTLKGALAPATAFGADFALEVFGTKRLGPADLAA